MSAATATVLYFAALTDFSKTKSHQLSLPPLSADASAHGVSITNFKKLLLEQYGELLDNERCRAVLDTCAVAVNLSYVDWSDEDFIVKPGDEVALIPPVSGG
jgi:molybdopterin converting factor small subunit